MLTLCQPGAGYKRGSRLLGVLVLTILGVVVGCETPARQEVDLKGEVTIDGAAVESGSITFTPRDNPQAQAHGGLITNGRYAVQHVPVGKHLVTFVASRKTGKMIKDYSTERPEIVDVVPSKARAGIAIEVASGDVARDFNLSSK